MKRSGNGAERLREFLTTTAQGKSYGITAATLLLLLVVFFLGIVPAINAASQQYANNQVKAESIQELQNKLNIMKDLITEEQSKAELVDRLNQKLPNELQEEDVIRIVNGVVTRRGAYLNSISFSDIERTRDLVQTFGGSDKLRAKYANIEVEGTPQTIAGVLSDLESATRVFNIRALSYSRRESRNILEAQGDRSFRINISAEVFYWDTSIVTPVTEGTN